jgi:cyanophycinase
VTGPVALHGGGEFLAGDEKFLAALLEAAGARLPADEAVRVVIVPTAAAGTDPDGAARLGAEAFERVAERLARPITIAVARVVDAGSADEPELAARLAGANLIYLPGGDPAVIPSLLPESAAWRAIVAARERGAILAGASAGAMALGPLTWTPGGIVPGLAVVRGLVVFPHADAAMWARHAERFPAAAATGLGILGLGERTGIISPAGGGPDGQADEPGTRWQVVGEAEVRWLAPGSAEPVVLIDGQTLDLPA